MLQKLLYASVSSTLQISGWLQDGKQYDAPVHPDRLLWIDPLQIEHKPVAKPPTGRFPPTLVAGGDWDLELEPVKDDVVYRTFRERFVKGKSWDQTGYVEFLQSDISEHGSRSQTEVERRCERLDELYTYISEEGYKTQPELERDGSLIDELSDSVRPPEYREIAVNITREGEFVWHAGMHRLVISQLLGINSIPVRVNTRHEEWQAVRDEVYRGETTIYGEHPDVEYLIDQPNNT